MEPPKRTPKVKEPIILYSSYSEDHNTSLTFFCNMFLPHKNVVVNKILD